MAGRGPLPTGTAIRRNKPTIPTTNLPAAGRTEPVPDPPALYELGDKALDWWGWAWRLPQACGWSDGDLFVVARRALLEDDLTQVDPGQARLQVMREMRELDDRLGLTAKGLAALRWKITDDEATATGKPTAPKAGDRKARLRSVG
jgi:hypothetical protein